MYERFTTQAREVVAGAQREALKLRHRYTGTEHLLLALLDSTSGIPYAVLSEAGIDNDGFRADIARVLATVPGALGEGDAAALEAIGIDLDIVRAKIEEHFGPGALEPAPPVPRRGLLRRRQIACGATGVGSEYARTEHRPFSPRAKKVLELALREALHLNHRHVGAEHILLGLLREGEGLAAKILTNAGLDLDDLRRQTLAALKTAA
jgi:ATP-dependent Clp protease ATP-binding subunit ClpA